MSKLSFRARALDASKPMPIYLAEELPDLPDYSAINRAVPQMPSGMEKEEESEHHLQRAISGTGLIIPTPEVCQVSDIEFYEKCYPPDYRMPKQHIHMQPLWEEQEAPEYDMDSEDERWLKQQRHPELTELKFEQMMDKLEKSSGQTVVTLNEAKLLLERHDDLVIAVYDYWLNKRLTTQHPLILSVKTENRPGQSSNNPYLAFRRRTEKMQTRKNRKNDESSYEKMLKLRRDLARALSLLELVARRERSKREMVKLTALLSERRYVAGDFANQLLPDPPPRTQYTAVSLTSSNFRRETYSNIIPHYPPRPPPTPVDQPRQREKRTYKRRKHRHAAVGSAQGLRDSGVYTSSEEESPRVEPASPPDDGPFAFRRKPGCYYEMPTSTLCGDPVEHDGPSKEVTYQHEIDPRHRFTLTSLRGPAACVGFARRRVARGGRLALDRAATPLDELWRALPFPERRAAAARRAEELEIETKRHRTPKEITRDYHTSGKYPWRHAFRRHLSRHPELWISEEVKPPEDDKEDLKDLKFEELKCQDIKVEPVDLPDVIQDSVKSDISVRTMNVDVESGSGKRKRSWSDCSDSSYDSEESLHPVEKEFENFIDEVHKKWIHFRPKTPPPSPPPLEAHEDQFPVTLNTPISVELRAAERPPSDALDTFTTAEFTLGGLFPELTTADTSGASLDVSGEDLLGENFTGLTDDQMESILSETDLKALAEEDDKKINITDDILDQLVSGVDKDPFLLQGRSAEGRADSGPRKRKAEWFGSSRVRVAAPREPLYCAHTPPPPPKVKTPPPVPRAPPPVARAAPPLPRVVPPPPRAPPPRPAPVAAADIIVEEVNDLPPSFHKKNDTIEEVQLPHGVQLKTVAARHSPLKKHIITAGARLLRSEPRASLAPHQPQIVTVAVSDSLKVRLHNHLLSTQAGVLVQNGPFPPVVAVQHRDTAGVTSVSSVAGAARRVPVQVSAAGAGGAGAGAGGAGGAGASKLKLVHAHPLTQAQRAQLLAHGRAAPLPAVVSLAALADAKGSVAQLFEIKAGHLGKGPHLVNVVRQPAPARAEAERRRQALAEGARPQRVSVSLAARQLVRAPAPPVQLRARALQPSAAITLAPPRAAAAPGTVVGNLLHKNIQLPKGAQKIAISGAQALSANVQAIAFSAAHVRARQARLAAPPRAPPVAEIVEASTAPVPTTSKQDAPLENDESETNGTVRRRTADSLPMEVT